MLNQEQLNEALEKSPAPRITPDYIKSRIKEPVFTRFSDTVTICHIEVDNGFSVRGESACVDPANYNKEIGEKIAYEDAFKKLWPLFGFVLAESRKQAA